MASYHYWGSPTQVGTHELAKQFVSAGWQAGFVSDPISPLHILRGADSDLAGKFRLYSSGGQYYCENNLWAYVPGTLLYPYNAPGFKTGWVYRHWHRFAVPDIACQISRHGFNPTDVLYFDNHRLSFLIKSLNHRRSVLRIADKHSGFKHFNRNALQMESDLMKSVDLVVYVSEGLEDYVRSVRPKRMLHLPNGVDFDHFAGEVKSMPEKYRAIPKPIAIYVGSIDDRIDYHLIHYLANHLQQVSFVFIGPGRGVSRLPRGKNIYYLGYQSYDDLPSYLHHSDLGIMPFGLESSAELVHHTHPLKMYQYFACGLPVVSVAWDELKRLKAPVLLSDSYEQFAAHIRECLSGSFDKESFVRYASEHDWKKSFELLVNQLNL